MSVLTVLIIVFFVQSFIIEQNVATGIIKTEKKALEQSINQLTDFLDKNLHSYETINYLNGNNQGTIDAFLANDLGKLTQLAKEFTRQDELFENISFTDSSGKIVASSISALVGFDNSALAMWQKCYINGEKYYINPKPIFTSGNTEPVLLISSPIFDNNSVIGIITLAFKLGTFSERYILSNKIGSKGYYYIIDLNGDVIIHPSKDLIGKSLKQNNMVNFAMHNREGFIKYKWEDETKYQQHKQLENIPWFIAGGVYESDLLSTSLKIRKIIIFLALISLALLFLVIFFVLKYQLEKPVDRIVTALDLFANQDFSLEIPEGDLNRADEIGLLANAYQIAQTNIKSMVIELQNAAETLTQNADKTEDISRNLAVQAEEMSAQASNVATASEEISTNAVTVASAAEETSLNVSSVASAMEQMSANINMVAASGEQTSVNLNSVIQEIGVVTQNIEKIKMNIEELKDGNRNSASAVEEMSVSLNEVSNGTENAKNISAEGMNEITETNNIMKELKASADSISKIINIINDIADQTNMLALNATIEAASAGDAGKGFAVVANEVKELAKQTANAISQIATQIDTMHVVVDKSVSSISNVSQIIDNINEININIANTVEEQTKTIIEISRTTAQGSENSEQVADFSQEILTSVQEVNRNLQEAGLGVDDIAKNSNEAATVATDIARNSNEANLGVTEIAKSTNEINIGLNEISENIIGVADVTTKTAAEADEVNNNAKELSIIVTKLHNLISKFKI